MCIRDRGYCFGGMPALDLARSGAPLVDVVVFHGSLGTPNPESDKNIKGHVLALHGAADPIVNAEAVATFEKELTDAGVDWQVDLYGGVMHAFTDHVHVQAPEMCIRDSSQAVGLPMSALVDSAASLASRIHVVRAAERPNFIDTRSGAKRDNFGPKLPGSKVEFLRYVVPPRRMAGPFAAHAKGTIEHMHAALGPCSGAKR